MKYSAVALAAFVAIASAQDISVIPSCALPCVDDAATKVCTSKTDHKCLCENKDALVSTATSCVISKCGAAVALNDVLPATEKFCQEVLAGGSDAAPSSSAAAATTATTSAIATATAPTSTVSAAPSSSSSSNGTVSMAPPASSSPVNAGAASAGYIGSFGVAALAALAAF